MRRTSTLEAKINYKLGRSRAPFLETKEHHHPQNRGPRTCPDNKKRPGERKEHRLNRLKHKIDAIPQRIGTSHQSQPEIKEPIQIPTRKTPNWTKRCRIITRRKGQRPKNHNQIDSSSNWDFKFKSVSTNQKRLTQNQPSD